MHLESPREIKEVATLFPKKGYQMGISDFCINEDIRVAEAKDHQPNMVTSEGNSTHTSRIPFTRQFWSAGDCKVGKVVASASPNGQNRLCVHPKFLHSNATSHKWAFGAIAELLDNAVDEIHNGASYVIIDKICNATNESPAFLIQDDGSGMTPDSLRRCMSFGFSDKQSSTSIGHYGNGFKTSTMRLGADVIVFSRSMNGRKSTQSVGILSYTFLSQTGYNDVVVPMIDYHFDTLNGAVTKIFRNGQKQFSSNLSVLLTWSPFATEEELLKNFNDIGDHGTKIIIYNLWFNDAGDMELDFQSDEKDILITGAPKLIETRNTSIALTQNHIANKLRYSLRAYCSILYLHIPAHFRIILRGVEVQHHNLVKDLKFCECVMYKPKVGGRTEAEVITTIGFLKDAPLVNVHGFNIYHKNRLILPFCQVTSSSGSRGRGISGVLETNFIKPTHNKQGFEKSKLYQKLEARLREMTYEYWECYCHLIGYEKKIPPVRLTATTIHPLPKSSSSIEKSATMNPAFPQDRRCNSSHPSPDNLAVTAPLAVNLDADKLIQEPNSNSSKGVLGKRAHRNEGITDQKELLEWQGMHSSGRESEFGYKCTTSEHEFDDCVGRSQLQPSQKEEIITMMQAKKNLRAECLELVNSEKELLLKEQRLRLELDQVQQLQRKLFAELHSIADIKVEKSNESAKLRKLFC